MGADKKEKEVLARKYSLRIARELGVNDTTFNVSLSSLEYDSQKVYSRV